LQYVMACWPTMRWDQVGISVVGFDATTLNKSQPLAIRWRYATQSPGGSGRGASL
jgi:hypothetical protein